MKRYVELQARYVQLDFVSKMTVLIAAVTVGAILFALLSIVILFLSYALALALAPSVGGMPVSCGIIALIYVAMAITVYLLRQRLIINPIANFLGQLFLNKTKEK